MPFILLEIFFFDYDQFQLTSKSRDLTTMKTLLELMKMCTLLQGATNSIVHMQNAMNQILRDFVLEKIILFVDDILITDCKEENKDLTLDVDGCKRFMKDDIEDVEQILKNLKKMDLILFIDKSKFRIHEIIIINHLYRKYGKKSNLKLIDAIVRIKACYSIIALRRF